MSRLKMFLALRSGRFSPVLRRVAGTGFARLHRSKLIAPPIEVDGEIIYRIR